MQNSPKKSSVQDRNYATQDNFSNRASNSGYLNKKGKESPTVFNLRSPTSNRGKLSAIRGGNEEYYLDAGKEASVSSERRSDDSMDLGTHSSSESIDSKEIGDEMPLSDGEGGKFKRAKKMKKNKKRKTVLEATMSNLAKILEKKNKQEEERREKERKFVEEMALKQIQKQMQSQMQSQPKSKKDEGRNLEEYLKKIVKNRVGSIIDQKLADDKLIEEGKSKNPTRKDSKTHSKTNAIEFVSKLLPMNRTKSQRSLKKEEGPDASKDKNNPHQVQARVAAILKKTRSRLKLVRDDKSDNFFRRKLKAFEPLATFINAKDYVDRFDPFRTGEINKGNQTGVRSKAPGLERTLNVDKLRLNYSNLERKPLESNEFYLRKKDDLSDAVIKHLHSEFDKAHRKETKFKDWDETHDIYFHDTTHKLFYNKDFFLPTQHDQAGELRFQMNNLEKFVKTVLSSKGKLELNNNDSGDEAGTSVRRSMIEPKTSRSEEPQSSVLKSKGLQPQKKQREKENVVNMVKQAAKNILLKKENELNERLESISPRASAFRRDFNTSTSRKTLTLYKDSSKLPTEESYQRPSTWRSEFDKLPSAIQDNPPKEEQPKHKTANKFFQAAGLKRNGIMAVAADDKELPNLVRWNNKYDKAFLTPQNILNKKVMFPQHEEEESLARPMATEGMFLTSVPVKEMNDREKADVLRKKVSLDLGEFHFESEDKLKKSHFQKSTHEVTEQEESAEPQIESFFSREKKVKRGTYVQALSKKISGIMNNIESVRDDYLSERRELEKIYTNAEELYSDMKKRANPGLWSLSNTFDKLNYVDRKLIRVKHKRG